MTSQLKWRLGKLPTSDEVIKLLNEKIITKEEAKEILFNNETEEKKDIKSLENEVKFLKEIIEKLSDRNRIVETIRVVEKHYPQQQWLNPYITWCDNGSYTTTTAGNGGVYLTATNTGNPLVDAINCAFSQIA